MVPIRLFIQHFVRGINNEIVKACVIMPLLGESNVDRWIPPTEGHLCESHALLMDNILDARLISE